MKNFLKTLRIDGVFLPNQNTDNPIYFLEVQFQIAMNIC
ncbi:MAG: DUF2887 domain-containing protein [Dolichospermum sp. LBC05a]|nr:DUF2887 domain-containing protein [Dolichospermum sp. OL01]MCO5796152.1 DUF2887 domain-containing protein [Dolichospermum sp. OL03]QSV57789.1 MAG: DUF2887 domain-containing protein [Dolichospermum sp. LBC05a]